ncbi:MAG: hypothetical protein EOP56_02990 [Sphingobacteriales bacterium]|nr:MAG: hypothetical protein EOP56_02990 [Sphingobacteriales bacterium]
MRHDSKYKKHIISSSFIVSDKDIDHEKALSICNILQAINSLNDETIVALFGTLDYNKILVKHFNLDIVGKAFADDTVTLYSYASRGDEGTLKVNITALRKDNHKETPIVNGSFVFNIGGNVDVHYSLS